MGSDQVEAINAISGERCNPHPHNFTDRLIRPGDQAFFDIIHSYNGYRTCYYRTFAVGSATASQRDAYTKAREWMDRGHRRGSSPASAPTRSPRVLPKADEFGFEQRDGRLRPAVRPRPRARPARAADHLPAQLHEGAGRAPGRHGVRAGDLLPGQRRVLGGPDRGGGRRHRRRPAHPHAVPGRRTSSSPTPTDLQRRTRHDAGQTPAPTIAVVTDLFIGGKRVPASRRRPVRRARPGHRRSVLAPVADGTVEDAPGRRRRRAEAAAAAGPRRPRASAPRSCARRSS